MNLSSCDDLTSDLVANPTNSLNLTSNFRETSNGRNENIIPVEFYSHITFLLN